MSRAEHADAARRRVLVTPEGIAMPVTLASRGSRLGALMIDLIIIIAVIFVVVIVLGFAKQGADAAAGGETPDIHSPAGQFIEIVTILTLFALRHGYFLMFELGPRGATPGKRMTGIRSAARSGGRLSTEMVLARNLLQNSDLAIA